MRTWIPTGPAMLAALLTGCGAEPGPTAENAPGLTADRHVTEHSTTTIPEDNFAVNPCNGETVHFIGTITERVNRVGPDDGGTLHVEVQDLLSASGTGLTTGVSYRVDAVSHVNFESPSPPVPNATFTELDHFDFIVATPGLSFRGAFFVHLVDLPSGEEKVTREVDTEAGRCLG
jgi:hypothetical protein